MNVTKVIDDTIDKRLITSWSIGYEMLTVRQLDEITAIVDLNNEEKFILKDGAKLLSLLEGLYDCNRLH